MARMTESEASKVEPPMLVYDGSCGFCTASFSSYCGMNEGMICFLSLVTLS